MAADFSVSQLRIPLQHDFQIVTHVGVRTIPNGNAGILCRRLKDGWATLEEVQVMVGTALCACAFTFKEVLM